MTTNTTRTPAITILICAYNRWPVVMECLRRLEHQTFKDFDVVLVDDGSPDETFAKTTEYAKTAPYAMQVLTQPNGGVGRARNHGLPHVQAPLTLMLGQDVWAHPDFVERHVNAHRQHPDERYAVLGLSRYYDPDRTVTPFERYLETYGGQFSYGNFKHGDHVDWRYFYTGITSAKTSFLRRYPSVENIFFLEDMAWGYRMERDGGLTVVYDALAIGDHYHPADVTWSLERHYRVGKHARILVSDVPELQDAFEVKGSPLRIRFYRWLAARHAFWRVIGWAMQKLHTRWAMAWWSGRVLRLYYFAGYEGLPKP